MCFAFFAFPALAASFDPQAATEAYLKSIPAAARLKSDAYFEGGYWLILWNALYNVVVYIILLATGLSARLRDLAFQIGRRTWPGIAIYAVLFTLVAALLTLPLDIYQGYIREHAYDLSNQTFPAWLTDTLIQLAVSMVLAAIVLPIIYAVIRNAPRLWWLWGTGVVMGFLTIIVLVSPVFLEPLLNHFQSLRMAPSARRSSPWRTRTACRRMTCWSSTAPARPAGSAPTCQDCSAPRRSR